MRVTITVTDSAWNRTHFRAEYASAFIPDRLLLITTVNVNDSAIVRLDLDVYSHIRIPVLGLTTPTAIDFDPTEKRMYWVNNWTSGINSAFLNGSDSRTDYTFNLDSVPDCRGLAVDYLSRLLFYTDKNNGVIGMLTINRQCRPKVIISTNVDRPHAVVVDMINGVIFWTDVGDTPRIERAAYDGSERRVIVSTSLRRPYGLALDISQNNLYWADAGLNRIEKYSLNGNSRTLVYSQQQAYFYGLAFYRGYLFVTNQAPYQSNSTGVSSFMYKVDTTTGSIDMSWSSYDVLSDVHCYDEENTPKASNGCGSNYGGCPFMCVPQSGNRSACLIPDSTSCAVGVPGCGGTYTSLSGTIHSPRYPRNYPDNLDCVYHIVQRASYRITLTFLAFDLTQSPQCTADFLEIFDGDTLTSPTVGARHCGKDVDPKVQRSTGNTMTIRFKTDGSTSGVGFLMNYTAELIPKSFLLFVDSSFPIVFRMDPEVYSYTRLQVQDLRAPVAVSYDPQEDRVYWTDRDTKEIRSAFLNATSNQLVYTLPGNADALCEGLAVDYISRLVFYADSGNDVIGSVAISDDRHHTVVNSGLDQPRAVALDMVQELLFWTDSGDSPKIESVKYDGSERQVLVSLRLSKPAGLALDTANSLLYWADAGTGQIERIDIKGNNRKIVFSIPGSRFFALTLGGDYLYVTDWGSVNSSNTYIRRVKTDSSEKSVLGWETTAILKGLHFYNETTRQRLNAPKPPNKRFQTAVIAGASAGGFVGVLVVIAVVVIFLKKRRNNGHTGRPVSREDSQTSPEDMSQITRYSHMDLHKPEDEAVYCELGEVQSTYASEGSLRNPYLTPTHLYGGTTPPIRWTHSESYFRPGP